MTSFNDGQKKAAVKEKGAEVPGRCFGKDQMAGPHLPPVKPTDHSPDLGSSRPYPAGPNFIARSYTISEYDGPVLVALSR